MPPTPVPPITPPEQFGPYRILRPLGRGGMGSVFLARDSRLDRDVALKICHLADDPEALERFRREARAAAALRHTNLCPVYEYDVRDGIAYLTMAFIEGPTLGDWARSRALSQRDTAHLIAKLALAMQAAHDGGVIHRDLKPSNIVIDNKDEPVILDFGLARQTDDPRSRLTRTGAIYGTPAYMAPEQAGGDPKEVGPACDVYGLGVVLYELLTGDVPFRGPVMFVLGQLVNDPPEPLRRRKPGIDATLEEICLKALAKRPDDRYPTMQVFADALTRAARRLASTDTVVEPHEGAAVETRQQTVPGRSSQPTIPTAPPPIPGRRRRRWVVPALLVCVLGGLITAGWFAYHHWHERRPETPPPPEIENSIGMTLVYIKPGTFLMGSPEAEHGRDSSDERQHRVTLTKGFYMSTTLVSQKQWKAVMGANNNPSPAQGDNLPVASVTWEQAREFCERLSARENRTYRLPTEAEWEYACRAGTTSPFWCGETITTDQANFNGKYPYRPKDPEGQYRQWPTPVSAFAPNAFGLRDMHGNLFQWCADWYARDYPAGEVQDPRGPDDGHKRVMRGGSWHRSAKTARSAARNFWGPTQPGGHEIGFRVVCAP
jgi:formylglycine-generating enzyme required for sulfatase activity/predicted Ser/Thr protein kinase